MEDAGHQEAGTSSSAVNLLELAGNETEKSAAALEADEKSTTTSDEAVAEGEEKEMEE